MTTPNPTSMNASQVIYDLLQLLQPYKESFEATIPPFIEGFGIKTLLRDACEYALLTPGKRFRPAIVAMVAESLAPGSNIKDVSLAVEFFHTASLIADDLPSMDDDDFRRGRPTVHKVYGEATALLASFALIAAAFELIIKNTDSLKRQPGFKDKAEHIGCLATIEAARVNGILGLIGGQYLDLYPVGLDKALMYNIIERKTAALFELSFVLGWLFSGGDESKLEQVKQAAVHFGSAFQILDDIDDMEKDKAAGRDANYAIMFSKEEAKKAIQGHVMSFIELLDKINLQSPKLLQLSSFLQKMCDLY